MRIFVLLSTLAFGLSAASAPEGAELYRQHCSACHTRPAAPRVPNEAALRNLSTRRIVQSLDTGIMMMPGRRVTPDGRRAIAEFLTGRKLADDPLPTLAGTCSEPVALRPNAPRWTGWSASSGNTRYLAMGGPAVSSLSKLRLRWAFGFEGDVVAFAHPAVFGGRVFTGSAAGDVWALDSKSGCTIWRFGADTGVRTAPVIWQEPGGRTVLFVGDLQSNLYALDAADGTLIWRKRLDPHPVARLTAAPALHDGKLYVPVSSFEEGMGSDPTYACCTFRGSVAALDAATGTELWRRYLVPAAARPTRKNSSGVQLFGPSGVAVWSTPTVDAPRGLVYVTTGDNYTDPATDLSDAVLALRLRDGAIAWSRQVTPGDTWNAACMGDKINCPEEEGPDHDFGSPAMLVRTEAGRELIIAAQKSGVVYALDPDRAGRIIWEARAGKGGLLGGIQWGPATDGRYVYAPISDVVIPEAATTGGGLVALRVETGKEVWRAAPASCGERRPCSPAQMAAATVIPGAVFSGARDGVMRAYSTETGKVLWSFDTVRSFTTVNGVEAKGGSIDGPGAVVAEGLVLIPSGYSYWGGMPGNVLLAFEAAP
ncbi:MAG TPA: PQQ-binding-like beta-propeller repeat protein [Bryobacteraceae bacterium]|nr:PQQ-binding-like beta-propeller repeat protein [Bryobacteraceae bacterium]